MGTIAAPVFDHLHRVALIVSVHPLCALAATWIEAIGKRLSQATTSVNLLSFAAGQ